MADTTDEAARRSALDAALRATAPMWGDVRTVHRARILEAALEAARPVLAAAERDRIRRLADEKRARYADEVSGTGVPMHWRLFGDLLDGDSDG
jgi:hypothetical protein